MASTRNKNTPGDYAVEQRTYKEQIDYKTNIQYGLQFEVRTPFAVEVLWREGGDEDRQFDIKGSLNGSPLLPLTNLEGLELGLCIAIFKLEVIEIRLQRPAFFGGQHWIEHGSLSSPLILHQFITDKIYKLIDCRSLVADFSASTNVGYATGMLLV